MFLPYICKLSFILQFVLSLICKYMAEHKDWWIYNTNLFCFDGVVIAAQCTATFFFKIYCASPNLDIRT